jgi:hypothetical protein
MRAGEAKEPEDVSDELVVRGRGSVLHGGAFLVVLTLSCECNLPPISQRRNSLGEMFVKHGSQACAGMA